MYHRGLIGAVSAVALVGSFFVTNVAAQADQSLPNPPQYPIENPELPGQVVLGKFLFWEEQISSDNTVSCGTCHIISAGGSDPRSLNASNTNPGPDTLFGTDDDIFGSAGVVHQDVNFNFVAANNHFPSARVTGRRTPPALNAAHNSVLFWDGRATSVYTDPQTGLPEIIFGGALESQAAGPPLSDVEMTREGQTWNDVVAKLQNVYPGGLLTNLPSEMASFVASYGSYPEMFQAVYGDPAITSKRVMFAIANYERTLISDQTPMDPIFAGVIGELDPPLEAGRLVFQGQGNCSACHTIPTFFDDDFHNIGVRPEAEDTGRFAITGDPLDMGKFRTANLRNVKLKSPYFHNGGKDTLEEVVEFYDAGGDFANPNLDIEMLPLNLTVQQKADLVLWLKDGTLDPRVAAETGPFTRPTLASELPSLNSLFGVESLSGLGQPAKLLAHTPANIGNPRWLLGLYEAKPNAATMAAFSFTPGNGQPFPDPRYPVPMNVSVSSLFLVLPGTTDNLGIDTLSLAVAGNPALLGFKFYVQWFVKDTAALATGGLYGTKGVEVEIR
jgi:cytochrome c peroxidase